MMTIEQLNELKQADIRTADIGLFTDLREITIDEKASVRKRVAQYLEAVANPFLVKIGDYAVKCSYEESGEGMEERMLAYVSHMAGASDPEGRAKQ